MTQQQIWRALVKHVMESINKALINKDEGSTGNLTVSIKNTNKSKMLPFCCLPKGGAAFQRRQPRVRATFAPRDVESSTTYAAGRSGFSQPDPKCGLGVRLPSAASRWRPSGLPGQHIRCLHHMRCRP